MATQVVIQQPTTTVVIQSKQWSTGLFDCLKDMNICCSFFWCFWCMSCSTAQKFGENLCLPLLDMFNLAGASYIGIPVFMPPIALSMRTAVRHRYGIPGTICKDCPKATFCTICSWCQIAREIKIRSKPLTVINIQPAPLNLQYPVINTLPGGMNAQPAFMGAPPILIAPPPGPGYVVTR
ncbi:hypothetical protein AAFF_G00247550 [Aldrovandia affinis]|uniref:Uncharacterized protein n=1 Tax=Aldrovandia affinis TaxID=143900 RepID=A0AAD7SVI0_9TELE|nr:hypothetical protein AAFF_G00247550 [Aldrovandia affinis]